MSFLTLNRQIYGQFGNRRDHGEISNDLSDRRRGVGSSCQCRIRKILTMSGVTKIMQIYEEEQV